MAHNGIYYPKMAQERNPRSYKNGKIYMIESLAGGVQYIGSTCGKLPKRMEQHRKTHKSQKPSMASLVMKFPDARILLIEDWPCESKEHLVAREAHHIRNGHCVNKNVAVEGFTNKHHQDNAERIKKQDACHICRSYIGINPIEHFTSRPHQEILAQQAQ